MTDHDHRLLDGRNGRCQVLDECLGSQCRWRRPAMTGSVEGVDVAELADPRHMATPRSGVAHEAVQQQNRLSRSTFVMQHECHGTR